MPRYIDADKVMEEINRIGGHNLCEWETIGVKALIDRQPTADVAPKSEGYWFILEYEYFTCSECGYYHPNGCDSTREAKENLADGKAPNYCPDCGAKMKGGVE